MNDVIAEALGARTLGGDMGEALQTIILASSVLYEIIGPACAKLALYLSGSYSNKLEDLVPAEELTSTENKSNLELLIERIQKIQEKIPPHALANEENEKAFTEAAEEQYQVQTQAGFKNRNIALGRRKKHE